MAVKQKAIGTHVLSFCYSLPKRAFTELKLSDCYQKRAGSTRKVSQSPDPPKSEKNRKSGKTEGKNRKKHISNRKNRKCKEMSAFSVFSVADMFFLYFFPQFFHLFFSYFWGRSGAWLTLRFQTKKDDDNETARQEGRSW